MVEEPAVDDERFEDAFQSLLGRAYKVTFRLLGDVAEAEDAAAEALARALVAWPRIHSFTFREAWVARVATNVALDRHRRLRRAAPAAATEVQDPYDSLTTALVLAAAVRRLPRRQRQVVALRFLADLDEADVARALGISVNSVHTHSVRGLAALRQRLGPWPEVNLALD